MACKRRCPTNVVPLRCSMPSPPPVQPQALPSLAQPPASATVGRSSSVVGICLRPRLGRTPALSASAAGRWITRAVFLSHRPSRSPNPTLLFSHFNALYLSCSCPSLPRGGLPRVSRWLPVLLFPDTFIRYYSAGRPSDAPISSASASCRVLVFRHASRLLDTLRCCGRPLNLQRPARRCRRERPSANVDALYRGPPPGRRSFVPAAELHPTIVRTPTPRLLRGEHPPRPLADVVCRRMHGPSRAPQGGLPQQTTNRLTFRPAPVAHPWPWSLPPALSRRPGTMLRLLKRVPGSRSSYLDAGCCGIAGFRSATNANITKSSSPGGRGKQPLPHVRAVAGEERLRVAPILLAGCEVRGHFTASRAPPHQRSLGPRSLVE